MTWPGHDLHNILSDTTHILISIPPGETGDLVAHYLKGPLQSGLAENLVWVAYLSTTAVYGQHYGAWVDETTPAQPSTDRGRKRLNAEQQWQKLSEVYNFPLTIFRLAGIYGPGRGPLEQVLKGTKKRIINPGQVFNRIHVDDIAGLLQKTIESPQPGQVFNVCDDTPESSDVVLSYAAQTVGLPEPPEVSLGNARLSPMARSFYTETKRVRNEKMKSLTEYTLQYPTYIQGIKALANQISMKKGQ